VFDPFDLALEVTPSNVVAALERRDFLQALILAFRYSVFVLGMSYAGCNGWGLLV
jgi:hypothetical protein